jgi:hypothetical protein
MNEKAYTVYLAFKDESLLPFPISTCKCHDGGRFCSHALASLGWISLFNNHNFEASILPPPILSIQHNIIPYRYVMDERHTLMPKRKKRVVGKLMVGK